MSDLTDRLDEAVARAICLDTPGRLCNCQFKCLSEQSVHRSPWMTRITATARTALLAELDAAGWVVVPKVATCEMLQDGEAAYRKTPRVGVSGMTVDAQIRNDCAKHGALYIAMLAAAPKIGSDREKSI